MKSFGADTYFDIQMAMGSPPENYDCDRASTLLRSAGEEQVSMATQRLLGKGIMSKSQRDPQKQRPGRQLKISDRYVRLVIVSKVPKSHHEPYLSAIKTRWVVQSLAIPIKMQ
jgi:transcription factor C subunit 3